MFIEGIFYPIINVLLLLMQSVGPTPVAGIPGGTTAAFLERPAATHAQAIAPRLR